MNKIYIATIIILCFSACIVNSPLLTRTQQPTNSILDKHYALSPQIDWFTANIRGVKFKWNRTNIFRPLAYP